MHHRRPAGDGESTELGAYATYATTRTNLSVEMQSIELHAYGCWGDRLAAEEDREAMYQMTSSTYTSVRSKVRQKSYDYNLVGVYQIGDV
jgi:hypothetical protein